MISKGRDPMSIEPRTPVLAGKAAWAGRILTTLAVLFLLMDGVAKVIMIEPVRQACAELDIPEWTVPGLGVVLVASTLAYAVPQTALLGAVLLTGYLGGAVWTHVRMGGPPFSIAFPILLGTIAWLGIYLREPRLRALLPWRPVR
jgi:hypothetical protein